ncbi:DMT family transporter [Sphingobium sufflavum]|uniref:DMT family transporter n=1 Tax=Sphingobium sufflavum TaxID=1129547 RepID=UPI001F3AFE6D|nr:DMT family transporter [Sphingobium sufflavum]MCE7796986.1 DMT family transporter [Sphingobium sufflavum]
MAESTGKRPAWHPYAMLVIVMLLWAGNSIVARAVRGDIPPFTLALVRWTGAVLVVLPFAWRHVVADWPRLIAGWRWLLLLGLTGVGAFNALLYSGLRFTTATNGLLVQAAIPAMVLLLNWLFFRTRAGWAQVGGVLLSTAGVLLIVAQGAPLAIVSVDFNRGDVMILGAVLCWAAYTSLLRLRPDCHPLSFLVATFLIGMVAMAPLAATESAQIAAMRLTGPVIGAFAYVAVLPSVVAYLLYNGAVRDIGAGRAGQMISLMPLFGSLLAVALLGEVLHAYHLWGMAVILAGIIVAAVPSRA